MFQQCYKTKSTAALTRPPVHLELVGIQETLPPRTPKTHSSSQISKNSSCMLQLLFACFNSRGC